MLVGSAIYGAYVVPVEGFEWHYVAGILTIAVLSMLALQAADVYQVQAFRGHEKQYMRLASAWSVVFLVAISMSFFAKAGDEFSRVWLGSFYVLGLVTLIAFRRALFLLVRRWTREGRLDRRTVVVGADARGESLINAIVAQRDSDVRIVGLFDDRGDDRAPTTVAGRQKLGSVDDLVEFARRTRIDLVIFSLPISAEGRILQMLKKLWVLPVDIRLAAHSNKLRFRPRAYSYIGSVPVLDVFDKPITDWDVVTKCCSTGSSAAFCSCSRPPIMLLAAIAIKLDSRGPVFFKQKRYGFNNELIEVYKFRSMYVDKCDATASVLVSKGDAARHQGRRLPPQDLDRRAAAAHQRRGEGQPVAGRAAPARGLRQGREPALRRGRGRLFRPPSGQARDHRLGAGQRLARRDRHPGEDPAPRRARPLLHRELVGAVRPLHPGQDAVCGVQRPERLLMSTSWYPGTAAALDGRGDRTPAAP